jgi:hypothetical protein
MILLSSLFPNPLENLSRTMQTQVTVAVVWITKMIKRVRPPVAHTEKRMCLQVIGIKTPRMRTMAQSPRRVRK